MFISFFSITILHMDILSLRVHGAEVRKTKGEQVIICFLCREEIFRKIKTTVDHEHFF